MKATKLIALSVALFALLFLASASASAVVLVVSQSLSHLSVSVPSLVPVAQPATPPRAAGTRPSAPAGGAPAPRQPRPSAPQQPGAPAAPTGAAPSGPQETAIAQVIERANAAQAQALTAGDPSPMKDTATDAYYREMAQTNQDLIDSGVTAIQLVKLEWGPVTVTGGSATATTYETWRTTYSDGTSDQSRDQNVYTLTLAGGAWKIQSDDHPDVDQVPPSVTTPGGAPAPQQPAPSAPQQPRPAVPSGPSGQGISQNWSGYAAAGGGYTAVSATWTVPQPDASGSAAASATWVGIGGETSRDLIQAGTEETVGSSGRVRYDAWIETLPQASHPISLPVHPGDSVTVSLAEQQPGSWLITFQNNTTGQDYQQTLTYNSSHSSAEWVEEAPSSGRRVLPITSFGAVTFTNASAVKDGKTVNLAQAGAQPITLIGTGGQALAAPSKLTTDGAGFTVTRTSAPAGQTPGAGSVPGRRRSTP
jgi:hypothetical protein